MASERRRSRLLPDEPAPSASPGPVRPPSPPDVRKPYRWDRGRKLTAAEVRFETDCLAGHIGLEPANPRVGHLFGFARQLRLTWADPGWRRPFGFQLNGTDLQLVPRFRTDRPKPSPS
jgi:hypothetical protein